MAESANGFLTSHIFSEMEPAETEEPHEHPAAKTLDVAVPATLGKLRVLLPQQLLNLSASLCTHLPCRPWAAPSTQAPPLQCVSAWGSPLLGGDRLY